MAEESNDSESLSIMIENSKDPQLYETIFNIVQEAQAAGSVVQIITIWPAQGESNGSKNVVHPTKCAPTGACPK
jgi:hypothetical protein